MLPRHEHCSRDSEHEVTVTFASMEAGRGSPFPQYFYFYFPSSSKEARAERRLQEGHEVQSTMIEVVCNDRLGKKVDVSFSGLVYARAA